MAGFSPNLAKKLALGSAQFGMNYGATNQIGQVPEAEVGNILHAAIRLGIDTIDSASSYGVAEDVLGVRGTSEFRLVTKLSPIPKRASIEADWVMNQVEKSLHRLRRPRLSGLLIHEVSDLRGLNGSQLIQGLLFARNSGLVEKIGVSIYSPKELDWIVKLFDPDIVQAPVNVFDGRLIRSGWLRRLRSSGVEVHSRSAYLQGSLLAGSKSLPNFLLPWSDLFLEFERWAASEGLTLVQAALGFPLSISEIDKVVVGVTSVEQLKEAASVAETNLPLYPNFFLDDENLINPINWRR